MDFDLATTYRELEQQNKLHNELTQLAKKLANQRLLIEAPPEVLRNWFDMLLELRENLESKNVDK